MVRVDKASTGGFSVKAVVGIDSDNHYQAAFSLLRGLGFAGTSLELVHAEAPLPATQPDGLAYVGYGDIEKEREKLGQDFLAKAQHEAQGLGMAATVHYQLGSATSVLLEESDAHHADLIAVGSTHKSKYGAFFLGSVGRALAIGSPRSILIAKREAVPTNGLTVVFATDGSEYADACLRMFARMHPKGVKRVVVLTAVEEMENEREETTVRTHVESLVHHLCELGIPAEGRVMQGSVHEVIDATMLDTNADLLALGAQGHGFIDRVLIGSVSLHAVVATPYSVLLLRTASV